MSVPGDLRLHLSKQPIHPALQVEEPAVHVRIVDGRHRATMPRDSLERERRNGREEDVLSQSVRESQRTKRDLSVENVRKRESIAPACRRDALRGGP